MVVPLLVGDDRSTTDRLTQLSGRGRLSVVKIGHLSVEAGELPVIEIGHLSVEAGELPVIEIRHLAVEAGELPVVEIRHLAVKTRELAVEVRNAIVVTPVIGIVIAVVLP